jgi:hypothetical protein
MTTPDVLAELAALRHRVDVLESREEIQQLRNTFHDCINTGRWSEIGGLWVEDGELDYDYLGHEHGRAAITAFFEQVPVLLPAAGDTAVVKQFLHAHTVHVDGETASGTSHLFATPVFQGETYALAGRFTDTYRRVEGVWRFDTVKVDLWYSVPLAEGWASANLHQMIPRR